MVACRTCVLYIVWAKDGRPAVPKERIGFTNSCSIVSQVQHYQRDHPFLEDITEYGMPI